MASKVEDTNKILKGLRFSAYTTDLRFIKKCRRPKI